MTMPKMMVIGRPTTMARNLLMKMLMMMMMAVVAAAQIVDGHADHDGKLREKGDFGTKIIDIGEGETKTIFFIEISSDLR